MKLPFLIISISAVACIHTAPVPAAGDWIASDSSQYSPVAHFLAHTTLAADGIHIAIDSGSLYVPGVLVPDSPPLMSGLSLTAILALPDSGSLAIVQPAQGRAPAERRAWRPLASSDSVHLVDVLHYGERVQLPPIQLMIPSAKTPEGVVWIIYRISGTGVELMTPLAPGGSVRRRDHPGGVRVYACGNRDVRGLLDSARTAQLRRAYGLAC